VSAAAATRDRAYRIAYSFLRSPRSSLSCFFLVFIPLARFTLQIADLHALMCDKRNSFRIERAPELWWCLVGRFALQEREEREEKGERERERDRERPTDRPSFRACGPRSRVFELRASSFPFRDSEKGAAPAAPQPRRNRVEQSHLVGSRKRTRRLAPAAATIPSPSPRLCSSTLPSPLFIPRSEASRSESCNRVLIDQSSPHRDIISTPVARDSLSLSLSLSLPLSLSPHL